MPKEGLKNFVVKFRKKIIVAVLIPPFKGITEQLNEQEEEVPQDTATIQ